MSTNEPQPAAPKPRQPFQFSLRTLLLLFVVLGSSLAVFEGKKPGTLSAPGFFIFAKTPSP